MSNTSKTVVVLICIIASIGFAFDIYELLMLPLILKDALAELGGVDAAGKLVYTPGSQAYVQWARILFFIPALVGGVFGLLGGYLTDLFGRRRVLTFSILLYAFSAMAAGFSTSVEMLLVCRCLVFIGVCVEFVAAVAWLAELFEDRDQRENVLGYTQAFSSLGGILVAFASWVASRYASEFPAIYGDHDAWRYTLISGVIPALPLIIIRPFLPESPAWASKRAAGTLKRPSIMELFQPGLIKTTIVTTLLFAASYGIAFGAIQQIPQILSAGKNGHKVVLDYGKEKAAAAVKEAKDSGKELPPPRIAAITANASGELVAGVQSWQETGGLVGRIALAILAVRIISRRLLFRIFQIPSLIVVPVLFYWLSNNLNGDTLTPLKLGMFAAGFFTVAQFSFWGNYIPLVFPLHLRGTGESFAANIGGRVIGTAAAWITLTLAASDPPDPSKIALWGAVVAGAYALVGTVLTFMLPEPTHQPDN